MNTASLLTTLIAFLVGFWVHNTFLKKQPIWYVVGGTLLFGEIFKWVTGIETIPLKIFDVTTRATGTDKVLDKIDEDLAQLR